MESAKYLSEGRVDHGRRYTDPRPEGRYTRLACLQVGKTTSEAGIGQDMNITEWNGIRRR